VAVGFNLPASEEVVKLRAEIERITETSSRNKWMAEELQRQLAAEQEARVKAEKEARDNYTLYFNALLKAAQRSDEHTDLTTRMQAAEAEVAEYRETIKAIRAVNVNEFGYTGDEAIKNLIESLPKAIAEIPVLRDQLAVAEAKAALAGKLAEALSKLLPACDAALKEGDRYPEPVYTDELFNAVQEARAVLASIDGNTP
jgi:hypothetical protein